MMIPNKTVPYEKSALSKLPIMLEHLSKGSTRPTDLYKSIICNFEDVNQFVMSLDILFALKRIKLEDGELRIC